MSLKDSTAVVVDGVTSCGDEPNNQLEKNTAHQLPNFKGKQNHDSRAAQPPQDSSTQLDQLFREDKSKPLDAIFDKDGRTVFEIHESCHPLPHYEKLGDKVKPQREVIVCPLRTAARNPVGDDTGIEQGGGLSDSRKIFLRDVTIILGLQLFVTFLFVFMCMYVESLRNFVSESLSLVCWVFVLNVTLFLVLIWVNPARTLYPLNYVLLGVFTLCAAYMLGFLCSNSASDKPPLTSFGATLATLGVILLVSIFFWDVTSYFFAIDVLFLSAIVFYLIAGIHYYQTSGDLLLYIFYCGFVLVIIFSLFHQVQLLFAKGKYAIEPYEDIMAALVMYIHVNIIFIIITRIILGPNKS